jgi:hypothetical protein
MSKFAELFEEIMSEYKAFEKAEIDTTYQDVQVDTTSVRKHLMEKFLLCKVKELELTIKGETNVKKTKPTRRKKAKSDSDRQGELGIS